MGNVSCSKLGIIELIINLIHSEQTFYADSEVEVKHEFEQMNKIKGDRKGQSVT